MSLHRKKSFLRPGLPELSGAALLVGTLFCCVLWLVSAARPEWIETGGTVLYCEIRPTHYNAQDYRPKVDVTYEYLVGSVRFEGRWDGFWPELDSPNALLPEQLDLLKEEGHPLVILYNPDDPTESSPHYPFPNDRMIYASLIAAGVLATGLYFIFVYPAWRAFTSRPLSSAVV